MTALKARVAMDEDSNENLIIPVSKNKVVTLNTLLKLNGEKKIETTKLQMIHQESCEYFSITLGWYQ